MKFQIISRFDEFFRLCKSQQHLSDSYERFNEARPYHSRSACGLHSIPSGLPSFPDPLHYTRGNRTDPDRLNILDWPESPRRYRSVQSLDTVSGLVDIVEDGWPIEGNRSIDCIYTQVNLCTPIILFYVLRSRDCSLLRRIKSKLFYSINGRLILSLKKIDTSERTRERKQIKLN